MIGRGAEDPRLGAPAVGRRHPALPPRQARARRLAAPGRRRSLGRDADGRARARDRRGGRNRGATARGPDRDRRLDRARSRADDEARRPHHLRGRGRRGRWKRSRRPTRPSGAIACSPSTSSTGSCCTRRSSASSSAGSPATRRCTLEPCGPREGSARPDGRLRGAVSRHARRAARTRRGVGRRAASKLWAARCPRRAAEDAQVLAELIAGAEPGVVGTQTGRYFGFVIGSALPASVAADWLATVWDQNALLRGHLAGGRRGGGSRRRVAGRAPRAAGRRLERLRHRRPGREHDRSRCGASARPRAAPAGTSRATA